MLSPGTRIGPYEIVSLLGVGGMGEVYRALDTKLNREVAIKVLLPVVANDADRLARFSREAQLLASLNHPNIAHIHGFEEAAGVRALVMELVEGPTLADRIAQGALTLAEALPIARQVAEAVETAHERGIIHRDLKPANIKVRADGTVKVLDFGLAKALETTDAAGTNVANSPTLSMQATAAGVILGTAAYMAPEQARGKVVDRRADIWAWGCVLFEMLAGRRAFTGDDVTDTMVAVLSKEPEWSTLPASAAVVKPLLARCLKKDPRQRLQAIGDARIQVEELISGTHDMLTVSSEQQTGRRGRPLTMVAICAAVSVLTALVTWAVLRPSPTLSPISRFAISLPASQSLASSVNDRDIAISSDGRQLAYSSGVDAQIMIRSFDQLGARPLPGVTNARAPFFSPDGRWVAFFSRVDEGLTAGPVRPDSLRKVSVTGGSPIVVCQLNGSSRGASWAPDDTIVFATNDPATGLLRIAAGGGEPQVLTRPDLEKGERDHFFPSVLPDGRGVLFTVYPTGGGTWGTAVLDTRTGEHRILIRDGQQAEYVESGHLIYIAEGTLWAVPFDLATLTTAGNAVPVLQHVMATRSAANFDVSREGSLIYAPETNGGALDKSLVWLNRDGQEEPIAAPPRRYSFPRLSPDNSRIAVRITDGQENNVWILHLLRQALMRLTPEGPTFVAAWGPEGSIIFNRRRGGSILFRKPDDGLGTEERLTDERDSLSKIPTSVSPDGKRVVYHQYTTGQDAAPDLMVLRLDGTRATEPLLQTEADERNAEISPDGRWIAYDSSVSGRVEVYVRPFPNVTAGNFQVSTGGGRTPVWAPNGGELFFVSGTRLMAAAVNTSAGFVADSPKVLFDNPSLLLDARTFATGAHRTYDVSRDARRFLVLKDSAPAAADETALASIIVVQNWREELKRVVPAR